jgi:hypothetical protein
MVTVMRVAGNEEDEGSKAMAMVTRVEDKRTNGKDRGNGNEDKAGKEEGNGKGGKNNSDGEEEVDGEEDGGWFSSFNFHSYVNPVQSIFLYIRRKTILNDIACSIGTH